MSLKSQNLYYWCRLRLYELSCNCSIFSYSCLFFQYIDILILLLLLVILIDNLIIDSYKYWKIPFVIWNWIIDRRAPWCFWLLESTCDVVEYRGSLNQSKWIWGTLLEMWKQWTNEENRWQVKWWKKLQWKLQGNGWTGGCRWSWRRLGQLPSVLQDFLEKKTQKETWQMS